MVHLKPHFSFNCYFKASLAISQRPDSSAALTFPDQGLQAYFREAFSITLQMSTVSQDSKLGQNISALLLGEQPVSERGRDLLSKLIVRKHVSHLEPESSEEVTDFKLCSPWFCFCLCFLFTLSILYWSLADTQCCGRSDAHSDLAIHIHESILPRAPCPSRLPHNTEQSSLGSTWF